MDNNKPTFSPLQFKSIGGRVKKEADRNVITSKKRVRAADDLDTIRKNKKIDEKELLNGTFTESGIRIDDKIKSGEVEVFIGLTYLEYKASKERADETLGIRYYIYNYKGKLIGHAVRVI